MDFAKLKDYVYSVACVVWLWVLDVTIKSSQKHHIWNSQSNLTSYTINVIFRLSCLGQFIGSFRNHASGPPWPRNPTPTRKHPAMKFKFIDSILSTNSNPQSIVVLLCLYKEWHHFQGTNNLYHSLQGYIRFVFLLFPWSIHAKWYIAWCFILYPCSGSVLITITLQVTLTFTCGMYNIPSMFH